MTKRELWQRYCRNLCVCEQVGLQLDISRMAFESSFLEQTTNAIFQALDNMEALEKGSIANPDEKRMVGHYWLRYPDLAPEPEITASINECVSRIKTFSESVHSGKISPPSGGTFKNLVLIGIGGSALGPQFVNDALGSASIRMRPFFCDNTDPDGIDRTLAAIGDGLKETLAVVISKSGGTKETRNGMLEIMHAYKSAGLNFAKHAVAVTGDGSDLHKTCRERGWIDSFPMWDWVGGRTSQTAAVGLLPAALTGLDIDGLLAGAREMDAITRCRDIRSNPAALLALMWYDAAKNRNLRSMVVIPYKDRLSLLSKYLQQLIMESLGKELDLDGKTVHEGITVYGNKGSTDQHAYVQQLREGYHDFYVNFIEVRRDRQGESLQVEDGVTSGDYLAGFLMGTREALYENGRESMTITVDEVSPRSVGSLIALYERAVGLFASLVNINAYHQPGVEAGKKAAGRVIALQSQLVSALKQSGQAMTAEEVASAAGEPEEAEWSYMILEHLAANDYHGVKKTKKATPAETQFSV